MNHRTPTFNDEKIKKRLNFFVIYDQHNSHAELGILNARPTDRILRNEFMCKRKNSPDAAYTAPGALIARQACQHRAPLPISLICLSLFSKNSPDRSLLHGKI